MKKSLLLAVLLAPGASSLAAVLQFDLSPPGTSPGVGLSPLNEIIPGLSSGSGNEIGSGITYDSVSRTLSLSLGYGSATGFTDLTGPAFSWLLHGPATTAETAPVVFDLAALHTFAPNHALGGTIFGSLTLSPTQASDLMAGLDYVNVYTPANLGGEIRGQLIVVPEPAVWQLGILGLAIFVGRSLHSRCQSRWSA